MAERIDALVNENDKTSVTVLYEPGPGGNGKFDWIQKERGFIASMTGTNGSGKPVFNESAIIPGAVKDQLGKPNARMDKQYFKVTMKRPPGLSIQEYF